MSNFELPVAVEVYRRFYFARLLVSPCDGDYNYSARCSLVPNTEETVMSHTAILPTDSEGIADYFTDMEHLRDLFKTLVAAPILPKRLLVMHGLGGVGKSSLLRMFRLHCKSMHIPVALASGEEANSAVDVLANWADDLRAEGIKLPIFTKTIEHYRAIQAKVDEQVRKAQDGRSKALDIVGKAGSKTAEAVSGAIAGAAIGSIIPGIGTAAGSALGGALGGMGAEALMDWLNGFLKKPDIDLFLDAAKRLTNDFLNDLAQAAPKHRLVLMLDTYEQMSAVDDWTRDLAQRVPPNVLLVIAGREMVNWDRQWPGWMAQAEVHPLEPMTPDVMRELVRNYYATQVGGEPDPTQVEKIIHFAHGLPMAVTAAVRLWVKYRVKEFEEVEAGALDELVRRLREGVPQEMIPVLEAAAAVRYFNKEILRAVMQPPEGSESAKGLSAAYEELRRFPFVKSSREGAQPVLRLHDSVREFIDRSLQVDDPERHRELHERAAAYFEKHLEKASGEESERLGLERLYHRIRTDERAGIQLFQEMAEELVRYQLVNRLRALLNDANTYPLEQKNSLLWREYYNGRLMQLEARITDAEKICQTISENEQAERKLRAYALCDWGQMWARYERMSQPGGVERALDLLERSRQLAPQIDSKLVFVYAHLREVYNFKCELVRAIQYPEKQLQFFQEHNDKYGTVYTLGLLNISYGVIGNWKKAFDAIEQGLAILNSMPENLYLRMRLIGWGPWAYLWSGRYAEAEHVMRDALSWRVGDAHVQAVLPMYLVLASALQSKYREATSYFAQSLRGFENLGAEFIGGEGILHGFLGACLAKQGELEKAEEHLNQSLSVKRRVQDKIGIPELLNWLGEICEVKATRTEENQVATLTTAEDYYRQSLERRVSRFYFECGALTGLVRVNHAQDDYAAIPPLLAEAEQLAQQYEYNDHLASLRLTQAQTFEVSRQHLEGLTALDYFKQAMVHALRYNRFLLDEVLSGRPQGTPLHPIIPHCLERSEEGRRMLLALRGWWRTGVNDIGTPRPDTISPILEGIPLLEAERIAREREPGDGSPHESVVEQIEQALT